MRGRGGGSGGFDSLQHSRDALEASTPMSRAGAVPAVSRFGPAHRTRRLRLGVLLRYNW